MPIGKLKAHFILCRVLVLSLVFSLQPSLGGIEPGDAAGSKAEATQRAEEAFRAGRYADALRELRGVLERYPDDGQEGAGAAHGGRRMASMAVV